MNRSDTARRRGLPLAFGMGLAVLSGAAVAQTPPPSPPAASTTPPAEEEAQPEIVVTGSRIRKDQFTSSSPVTIITSERSTLEGLSDTAQVLQQTAVAASSGQINSTFSGFVVDGGPGVQTLSIRGLGAQRTLVLLNGRRLPPAGVGGTVGPVDLNIIPDSIINRIELLKDGASSIYGSDAVAGVANIITRTRVEGLQVGAEGSFIRGGGDQYTIDGRWGWTGDNAGISVSAEYYRREQLSIGERDFLSCQQDYYFAEAAGLAGGIPGYGIAPRQVNPGDRTDAIDPRTGNFKCYTGGNAAGYVLTYSPFTGAFIGTRSNAPLLPGLTFFGANNNPAPGWRFIPFEERNFDDPENLKESLIPFTERATLFVQGDWRPEAFGGAELYTEILANRRESEQVLRRTFFPDISNLSPINPFAGTGGLARLSQPHIILPFDGEQTVDVWRALAGVRGDIADWRYDVYASFSRNDAEYSRITIPLANVVAGTGTLQDGSFRFRGVCPAGAPAGCVPLTDLFSLNGLQRSQLSPAQSAYLLAKDVGNTKYDQLIFEAQVTGDLFSLPAGDVGAAFGVNFRKDKIKDVPGELSRTANAWGSLTAGVTEGDDQVQEVYAEFEVPVLRGVPLVRDLSINLSGRFSDYDSVGSATTYKAGLNWKLNDVFRVRSTYGTSFRAPALYELFLEDQTSFLAQNQIDPCIRWGDPERPARPVIQQNCQRDGVTDPLFGGSGPSAQILTGGGLGRLEPEESQALSVGFVVTPPDLGLSFAIDYFDIKVENQVGSFPLGVVGACYSDPRFRTVPGFCDLFTRDLNPMSPNFLSITQIDASYRNIPTQQTKGFDLNIQYEKDFSFGRIEIESEITHTTYDKSELFAGRVQDFNGLVGEPEWVGNLQSRWRRGDWTFAWTLNYTGNGDNFGYEDEEGEVNVFYSGPSTIITGVPSFITHDLSVRYRSDRFEVIAGITNVTDEEPEIVSDSDAPGDVTRVGNVPLSSQYLSGYEGRGAFFSVSRRF